MAIFDRGESSPKQAAFSIEEDAQVDATDVPSKLLALPLRNTVIFPRTVVPVIVSKPRSQKVVKQALETNRFVGTFKLKDKDFEGDPQPQHLHDVGTACLILKVVPVSEGSLMVALQGVSKVEALSWELVDGVMGVTVDVVEEKIEDEKEVEALARSLVNTTQEVISQSSYLPQEMGVLLEQVEEDPLKLLYTVGTLVRLKPSEQQRLLNLSTGRDKFQHLIRVLSREVEMLKLGGKIQSSVKEEFDKAQKEALLRQRLKAIRKELGEEDPQEAEVTELRQRMGKVDLPEEVEEEVEKELKRLETMHPMTGERQVVRTYLEWILDLPWRESTSDKLDLDQAQKILDEDHYDLKEVKERLIEHLAVRKLREDLKSPILCFVGPPGVGKTSLGKSIARALGREFVRVSLGGMRDEAEIKGHRRTYVGAMPGKIIQGINRAGVNNPVFMLDEIDKVGSDFRGDPSAALLEVLDPEQNNSFHDHYLDLDFDLSRVMFIGTANVLDPLHPALRDRLEIIKLPGYSDEEKLHIAKKYLIPRQVEEHGLEEGQISFTDGALERIIAHYTREAGVRNLERELAKVIRKIAKKVAVGKFDSEPEERVTARQIAGYLGPQKVFPETKRRVTIPGVATGLAVTSTGGEILFIEATKMPGEKKFNLTGSLGDVMKESANAALSLVRARAGELGIDEDFFEKNDIHLHVPAGAVPKDGPSAGVAMVTALASLLSGRKVKGDVAMTGEITLSGLVLPVGGIKQKVLAAHRADIGEVILPQKNSGDLEKLEEHVKKDLEFKFVDSIDEVLAEVLQSS